MFLLLLLACGSPGRECETVTVPVDDGGDDALDAFTFSPAQLLDAVSGTRALEASDLAGNDVPATLTVTRGEGPAHFRDGEWLGRDGDGFELFTHDYDLSQMCSDSLLVPVQVAFTATALDVNVTATGTASVVGGTGVPTELETVFVAADIPLDGAELPEPPDTATAARVDLSFENGELDDLVLRWLTEVRSDAVLVFPPVGPTGE